MTSRLNRRRFVRDAAAMDGAGFWLGSQSDRVVGRSPNDRVNIACIGVGGKGSQPIQRGQA